MALYVLVAISILVFWVVIDHSRVRGWLPLMITGVFLRYLYQLFLISWLQIWIVHGESWQKLWNPILADITIWPVFTLLFVQFIPRQPYRFWYVVVYVIGSIGYEQLLVRFGILSAGESWHIGFAFLEQTIYYSMLYLLWQWLSPAVREETRLDD
ncbi:hypothetical protein [Tumebacillus permanentifrigoris]|uniref:Uncharacterized protein n=1 Tax=Tumebacillus permanentifrigoris TaxID=378543 RepID=A0A316D6X7_9BACL|nr:hypothetical protein [Tumebacillus permanentifrigoris]PWK09042.1 hypothetical protein C7459_114109 [Tumebacillus permanentifrigoris]